MGLLELPAELLDSIICFSLVSGNFENFMLTCSAIHGAGKDCIEEYNTLKRTWKHTRVPHAPSQARTILDVLRAIADDPRVAQHIEYLGLLDATDGESTGEEGSMDDEGVANEDLSNPAIIEGTALAELVRNSRYISLAGEDPEEWIVSLGESQASYERQYITTQIFRTVFVLTLLPNLKSITLPPMWGNISGAQTPGCESVLKVMMKESRMHGDQVPALGKLRELQHVEDIEYDPHPRTGFDIVSPFMHLPHMETLQVCNLIAVEDGYTGIPFGWHHPDIPCNIETLRLEGCCIDAEGIGQMLERMPRITSLSYSHCTKWHGCQHDWDAGAFVKNVAKFAGDRLRNLSVTIVELFGEAETGVASLHEFRVLRELELDTRIFAAPASESGNALQSSETESKDWSFADVPRISEILPASIENVRLLSCSEQEVEVLRHLFRDPKKLWDGECFPNLQSITVSDSLFEGDDNANGEDETSTDKDSPPTLRDLLRSAGAAMVERGV